MATLVSLLLEALASLLAIPVCFFLVEVIASIMSPGRNYIRQSSDRPRSVAILVPAHNESTNLLLTLEDIKSQMRASDRLLVVADNSTDDTAMVAAAAGADVLNRNDPDRRGKGYALDFGLRHLSADPPNTVIFFDADCRLGDHIIDGLVRVCAATRTGQSSHST